MRIDESQIKQGSKEWHDWRLGGIGGSEISIVSGTNPYKTPIELWKVKTGIEKEEDLSNKFFVKRGSELEPKARELINDHLSSKFEPCLFQGKLEHMKYSCDGYDKSKNEILEIKALGEKNHSLFIKTNEPLPYYYDQIQWGMAISETKKCYFASYNPSFANPLHIIEVSENKDRQKFLINLSKEFWKNVINKIQPEPSEKDFIEIKTNDFFILKTKYEEAISKYKESEIILNNIKEKIKEFSSGRNISGFGMKCFTSKRKGNIDYSKIKELESVNLENYRKSDQDVFYIRITENS